MNVDHHMLGQWCRRTATRFGGLIARLWREDDGQDLIEYALLTGIIAIAGILIFPAIQDSMADAYSDWNGNAQDIWEPPAPTT
jgi:Flp pilus assembly pilin Flp